MSSDQVRRTLVNGTDPIPTLAELFDSFPEACFNIDCKSDTALAPLIRDMRSTGLLDRVCIGSFSDRRLRAVREAFGAKVCTSAGPREVVAITVGATRGVRQDDGPHCLQIPRNQGPINLATERFVERAHRNGLRVHYWTIDVPIAMNHLIDVGADGIMTDQPATLRDVLHARSLWPH